MKVIVSDTTSLIALEGLQSIELLCAVFESILIPQAVLKELSAGSPDRSKPRSYRPTALNPCWIKQSPTVSEYPIHSTNK